MPSLVIHLLVPPLVLLATRRAEPRLAVLLLPFSLLPDLDFFIPPHRALLHSVFLMGAIAALAVRWRARGEARRAEIAGVAAFYLASHSFMDLFAGGVAPLWPLSSETYFLDVQVLFDTATLTPFPTFNPGSEPNVPQVAPLYEFLNGDQFAILALTLVVAGAWALRRARRLERRVVVRAPDAGPAPARGGAGRTRDEGPGAPGREP